MKEIKDWFKKIKEVIIGEDELRLSDAEINESLSKAGYFCPSTYEFHDRELLEWSGDVRYWVCKKCGNKEVAMALIASLGKPCMTAECPRGAIIHDIHTDGCINNPD